MNEKLPVSDVFATFFQINPHLSCIASKDALFEFLSPNWETALGWSIKELLYKPFLHFIHPDDLDSTVNEMKKLESGQVSLEFENRYLKKNGDYVYLAWTSIFHEGRYFAVAKVVTEIKELESIREQAQASSHLALIGEMTCGVAHELSTPLAIISESIQIAKEDALSGELKGILTMIENASNQMAHIVRGMRMVGSRSETREFTIICLREIVAQANSFFKSKLSRNNIEFKNSVGGSIWVKAVPGDILQILINLIANAQQALSAGGQGSGWIEVSSELNADSVFINIIDSGPGIAVEIADHIMEPFFTTKVHSSGIGLGLSISKRIAVQNMGKLYLEKNSRHTHFVLELPAGIP